MQAEIKDLTYLIRCSLWDEIPEQKNLQAHTDAAAYWTHLLGMAQHLKISPFIRYALKLGDGLDCPHRIYADQIEKLRSMAMRRMCGAEALAFLQEELRAMGIESAVIKGQALATAYARPQLRSGCDVDLYVEEKQEKAVYAWAKEQGFAVEKRVPGTHHGEIWHPYLGLIELHVMLCNADESLVEQVKAKEAFLTHPREDYVTLSNCGHPVVSIGMTDHMIFILAHMINHYLHGEATPRMLLDVNEFFSAYRDRIDLERLRQDLALLHYDNFFATVLLIGQKWLGFSYEKAWKEGTREEDALALLSDFCTCDRAKEDAIAVYDAYCKGNVGGGGKALVLKLSLLGSNIRTAWQLRHKMRLRSILSIGTKRIANLFFAKDKGEKEKSASDVVERRLALMKQMDLL